MAGLSQVFPPDQQAIRAKCVHPTGTFIEFKKEEIEQSIPTRFEQMVAKYPDRVAVQTMNHTLTYDELNRLSKRLAWAILAQRGEREETIALLFPRTTGWLFSTRVARVRA